MHALCIIKKLQKKSSCDQSKNKSQSAEQNILKLQESIMFASHLESFAFKSDSLD